MTRRIARLDADAELRAFVLERIQCHTPGEITALIITNFPPDRWMSRSSLYEWCQKNGHHPAARTDNDTQRHLTTPKETRRRWMTADLVMVTE